MEQLIEWLEDLELQTLTDDLKSEIIEKIIEQSEMLHRNSYDKGYIEARHDIIEHITYNM
jgi:hypothetical protein